MEIPLAVQRSHSLCNCFVFVLPNVLNVQINKMMNKCELPQKGIKLDSDL